MAAQTAGEHSITDMTVREAPLIFSNYLRKHDIICVNICIVVK